MRSGIHPDRNAADCPGEVSRKRAEELKKKPEGKFEFRNSNFPSGFLGFWLFSSRRKPMTRVIVASAVAIFLAFGTPDVSAQVISDTALKFIGNWERDGSVPRGNCGGFKDERGNLLTNC